MFKSYLKIAIRNLQRNKAYTAINVFGLALGIACSILIFSLVKYHVSFDHFHKNSERIYRIVTEQHRDQVTYRAQVPAPLGKVFREDYDFAEKVARIATFRQTLVTITNGEKIDKYVEPDGVAFTEPQFFDIFHYPLLEGNIKSAITEPNTAIITERMAKKYFGDEDPVNKTFRLENQIDFTITGVLRDLPENTDRKTQIFVSYASLKTYDEWLGSDDWGGIGSAMQCFVLLRPNIAPQQVEQVLPAYVKKHRPNNKNVHHYKLQPLNDIHFNANYGGVMEKKNLWVLSLIGLFLIATACVNFINLATALAVNRSREVGVRKVLGSVRRQIFWQFISETLVITVSAALVAACLALLVLPYVNNWFASQVVLNFLTDWRLLVFLLLLVITVTFFAGSYPALILSGFKPIVALKNKISYSGGFNIRRALIITQFAISQVLVIGMIVIAMQMRHAKQSDLGFNKDAIVMVPLGSDSELPTIRALKNRLIQLPGVEKVSLCYAAPAYRSDWSSNVIYDNRTEEETFKVSRKSADEDFLSTFDIQLVAGRNLLPSDTIKEFLVNETFARKLNLKSPHEVLGKQLALGKMKGPIIGVIKDFHDKSFHEEINPVCITTFWDNYQNCAVKIGTANTKQTLAGIATAWNDVYPNEVYRYEFLDEHIEGFYATEELMLKLIQTFSFIAILIGCLGLYGLVSFLSVQKTKEIGIRKVLGGTVGHILWIFGKQFISLIIVSFLISAPFAWWVMNNWLQDFKFRIQISPWIFILSILISVVVAAMTVGYQSVRAANANPIKSLRSE